MLVAKLYTYEGKLSFNEPMARHCSWRSGGAAERYYEPADKDDLQQFMAQLDSSQTITWIGLGSNLLVRDGGVSGVVIGALNRLNTLCRLDDGRVYAECGVTCAKLARFCQQQGLDGADFLAGIPGTVGGALAMNAGAFGSETWNHVDAVEMMDRDGQLHDMDSDQFEVGYRKVAIPDNRWFSAGYFKFDIREKGAESNIKHLLERRNQTQPIGQPSCGSVFMNPPGDHAARLIEACGLKGQCIGDACVSEKHANFIINRGEARASDIEDLIILVRERVKQQFDIQLHTEVRILGRREVL